MSANDLTGATVTYGVYNPSFGTPFSSSYFGNPPASFTVGGGSEYDAPLYSFDFTAAGLTITFNDFGVDFADTGRTFVGPVFTFQDAPAITNVTVHEFFQFDSSDYSFDATHLFVNLLNLSIGVTPLQFFFTFDAPPPPQNIAPVAQGGSGSGDENSQISGQLSASDSDGPNALSYSRVAQAQHGTVTVDANGSYTYTPNAGYHGGDSFTFKANDGADDSNVATVNLTVNLVNQAPVAQTGTGSGNENTQISGQLSASDSDGPNALSYSRVAQAQHGSATVNANGAYSYTPNAGYHGSDSFTFKANDGADDSNIATVNLTVNAVANPLVVTTADDVVDPNDGLVSLREAITYANGHAGADTITFDASLLFQTISVSSFLPAITDDLHIEGSSRNGTIISGNGTTRIFFVGGPTAGTDVTISHVTLENGLAHGGNSGADTGGTGGGGLGAGGAVFVRTGASLTLDDVVLDSNVAVGGGTGGRRDGPLNGGGGGGLGGNGAGNDNSGSGNGGGGAFANGTAGSGDTGGTGGGPAGGAGGVGNNPGQDGGDLSGGGGGGIVAGTFPDPHEAGGAGGFGGGGGGGDGYGNGGAGGFGGGGGGGGFSTGGDGGFGGGGGGSWGSVGAGGFGGGDGANGFDPNFNNSQRGGGGAGFGGAVFVMDGAALTITGTLIDGGGSVTGGSGTHAGTAAGSFLFLQHTGVTFGGGGTQDIYDTIADDYGNNDANNDGTTGDASAGGGVTVTGGTVDLHAANTYHGATTVQAGTLEVDGSIANSAVTVKSGATITGLGGATGALTVEACGHVAPGAGNDSGALHTGNLGFASGSDFTVAIDNGSFPFDPQNHHGYSYIGVTGTVALGGATLIMQSLDDFAPSPGESYKIIDNDGNDAVGGTFAGLTEGATFTFEGETLRISYVGGTGNDVVLTDVTAQNQPAVAHDDPGIGIIGSMFRGDPGFTMLDGGNVSNSSVEFSAYYIDMNVSVDAAGVGHIIVGNTPGTGVQTITYGQSYYIGPNFVITAASINPSSTADGSHGAATVANGTITVAGTIGFLSDRTLKIDFTAGLKEGASFTGDLFADNGNGADSDPENDPFFVTQINGADISDGQVVTLPSGALLAIHADGTFNYDTHHAFDSLNTGQTTTESFTYTITGGSTATASFMIVGDGVGDTTPPTITINAIAGNDVVNAAEGAGTITVSGTAAGAEDGQIVTLMLKTADGTTALLPPVTTTVSGGLWHIDLPPGATPAFPDGHYLVTADVSDAAGNPATEATRTITVDTHAPTITINTIAANDVVNAAEGAGTITVSGTAAGAEDGQVVTLMLKTADGTTALLPPVTTTVSGGLWHIDLPPGATPSFPDGHYLVTADVSDAAGNPATEATRTITVDTHGPTIAINTIAGNDVVNTAEGAGTITVSGTATGAEDGQVVTLMLKTADGTTALLPPVTTTVSGGLWHIDLPPGATPAFPDGHYLVTADVSDAAGNPATEATRTITVDTQAPAITINTIAGDDVVNAAEGAGIITVSGTAAGAEDGQVVTLMLKTADGATALLPPVTTSVSGGLWHIDLPPGATPSFPDGHYLVTADVSDAAGNAATEATRTITVDTAVSTPPVNIAPVNTVPGALSIEANTHVAIDGLSIADVDAGSGQMTTTLSVSHGTLTLAALGGAGVAGSGTASVTLTGTVAQINATLAAANNVIYLGTQHDSGSDTLTMVTNDNGNTGGGPLTDTDQVAIQLNTHLTGTPGADSFTALPGNERIDALTGVDTITFGFKLVDATVTYVGNQVIIDGPSSHTVLTGFEVFNFTDGTVNNHDADPLVDDLFYYSQYHDVWNAHLDADTHYHQTGWHEGRDPNAFFSTSLYLSANPDVRAAGVDPLIQFDQAGWKEGRVPSITFDPAAYLAANPDVKAAHADPLEHFLSNGAQEGRQPTALDHLLAPNGFDYVYYLQHNPDVAAAHVDPFQHFETVGWKEGRNPNALFDVKGYLGAYGDVAAAGVNPLDHYNQSGWHEGRDPSASFDTKSYLAAYTDVAAAHIDPLLHFLQYGQAEGRSAFADGHFG